MCPLTSEQALMREHNWFPISLPPDYDSEHSEPLPIDGFENGAWVYRDRFIRVEVPKSFDRTELILRIKHAVLREDWALKRIANEVQAFENLEAIPCARRERIPESVRLFVWQRDEGKCVNCGSQYKLEFDHIIPVADGGSSTERNIQLLCDSCNRRKGRSVI